MLTPDWGGTMSNTAMGGLNNTQISLKLTEALAGEKEFDQTILSSIFVEYCEKSKSQ